MSEKRKLKDVFPLRVTKLRDTFPYQFSNIGGSGYFNPTSSTIAVPVDPTPPPACTLSVTPNPLRTSNIGAIDITYTLSSNVSSLVSVYFSGTKNGVADIPPLLNLSNNTNTNPSVTLGPYPMRPTEVGEYTRYATLKDSSGVVLCISPTISFSILPPLPVAAFTDFAGIHTTDYTDSPQFIPNPSAWTFTLINSSTGVYDHSVWTVPVGVVVLTNTTSTFVATWDPQVQSETLVFEIKLYDIANVLLDTRTVRYPRTFPAPTLAITSINNTGTWTYQSFAAADAVPANDKTAFDINFYYGWGYQVTRKPPGSTVHIYLSSLEDGYSPQMDPGYIGGVSVPNNYRTTFRVWAELVDAANTVLASAYGTFVYSIVPPPAPSITFNGTTTTYTTQQTPEGYVSSTNSTTLTFVDSTVALSNPTWDNSILTCTVGSVPSVTTTSTTGTISAVVKASTITGPRLIVVREDIYSGTTLRGTTYRNVSLTSTFVELPTISPQSLGELYTLSLTPVNSVSPYQGTRINTEFLGSEFTKVIAIKGENSGDPFPQLGVAVQNTNGPQTALLTFLPPRSGGITASFTVTTLLNGQVATYTINPDDTSTSFSFTTTGYLLSSKNTTPSSNRDMVITVNVPASNNWSSTFNLKGLQITGISIYRNLPVIRTYRTARSMFSSNSLGFNSTLWESVTDRLQVLSSNGTTSLRLPRDIEGGNRSTWLVGGAITATKSGLDGGIAQVDTLVNCATLGSNVCTMLSARLPVPFQLTNSTPSAGQTYLQADFSPYPSSQGLCYGAYSLAYYPVVTLPSITFNGIPTSNPYQNPPESYVSSTNSTTLTFVNSTLVDPSWDNSLLTCTVDGVPTTSTTNSVSVSITSDYSNPPRVIVVREDIYLGTILISTNYRNVSFASSYIPPIVPSITFNGTTTTYTTQQSPTSFVSSTNVTTLTFVNSTVSLPTWDNSLITCTVDNNPSTTSTTGSLVVSLTSSSLSAAKIIVVQEDIYLGATLLGTTFRNLTFTSTFVDTKTLAFSLRVIGTYTGPLVQLTRSSDLLQQDFYADGTGKLDVAAVNIWRGAATVTVTTWYNQTGGLSATGPNATAPFIQLTGTICLVFDGTRYLTAGSILTLTNNGVDGTVMMVASGTTNRDARIFGVNGTNNFWTATLNFANSNQVFYTGTSAQAAYANTAVTVLAQYTFIRAPTTQEIRKGTVSKAFGAGSGAATNGGFGIGDATFSALAGRRMIGVMSEFVMYRVALSGTALTTAETEQKTYWGV